MEKHPLHLKSPELQNSDEVSRAVERKERREETKIPNDPNAKIEAYTERLENIFLHPDEETRKRNIDMFRDKIYDELLIKKENFPDSYFELQQRVARERGQNAENIPENIREQTIETAIKDQKASLDAWIDYLSSNDAVYPAWFKYFVWKNITKLSQFDKEKGEYKKRTKSTVAPYPDIYREPLAQIADLYQQVKEDNKSLKDEDIQQMFSKKFADLYASLTQKSLAASMEGKEELKGQWIKYTQGQDGDAKRLYASLEGKGTGWCTAGQSTAEVQINSGDFYVYYTNDSNGEPTNPRLAIRMEGNQKIGEVRGILPHQAVEPNLQEVLDAKLTEFGTEADRYKKKSEDMRILTIIDNKVKENPDTPLSKEELQFIYEIDSSIEGFGYSKDPRIEEILKTRNKTEDALTIFEITREQLATSKDEVNENTKLYIGEWNIDIYQTIKNYPNIQYLYESFPDKKIFTYELKTDATIHSPEQAVQSLEEKGIYVSDYAKDLLNKTEFSKESQTYNLVQFTVEQLGLRTGATTDEIYTKAQQLGLKLCPSEVGPHLRLSYEGKDWKLIAMKQITDRNGVPFVFRLHSGDRLKLYGDYTNPSNKWNSDSQFVFLAS